MTTEMPADARRTLNYTVVALIGMLAGIVIGCVASGASSSGAGDSVPPVPRPRSLEGHP